jgi:hypothetical protein
MPSLKKLIQSAPRMRNVTPVPMGQLVKKKGQFKGSTLKKGGSIKKAKVGAWQKKEGKSPSGGLNAKGRASYNRATGGNLKPPQPEGGPRKKSFCARMKGHKRKNTSAKTARDPKSRINLALKKWRC